MTRNLFHASPSITGSDDFGPKGIITYVSRTSGDVTIAGATADITGMSVTFNARAGRLYKASWLVNASKNATDRDGTSVLFTDSSNTIIATMSLITMGSTHVGLNFSSSIVFTASGSVTYKLRALSFSGSLVVAAGSGTPCVLMIEDVGVAPL
jgi:hypothetical protein